MLRLDADTQTSAEASALVDEYVRRLDRRVGVGWLDLFTADGYYLLAREAEIEAGNNVLIIGENMKRLRARITSGLDRDPRRTVHAISGVRTNAEGSHLTASFAVWIDGVPAYSGVYLMDVVRGEHGLLIRRCNVVLFGEIVHTPVFLPI